MTDNHDPGASPKRKLYESPQIRRIQLASEEVLVNGCKVAGSTMHNVNQPAVCGHNNNCAAYGS